MPVSTAPSAAAVPWPDRLAAAPRATPGPPAACSVPPAHDGEHEIRRVVRVTGVGLWLALSAHSLLVEPVRDHLQRIEVVHWAVSGVAFLIAFLLACRPPRTPAARRETLLLLGLQTVLALSANALLHGSSIQAGLLIVVAAQVGLLLPWPQATAWVLVQSGALAYVLLTHWKHDLDAWAFASGYLVFQLFAITTAQTAVREVQARRALAQVVEELHATRALLADASRRAERLQISRDLHDLLGHHLTGLGMHLQVAHHLLADSPAREHVHTAQDVARQLLGDVRSAVRGMRDDAGCDFPAELRAMTQGTPLTVHVTLPPDVRLECPVVARTLLRCAQEMVTNAARHAHATQVWLELRREGTWAELHAHDDGPGVPELHFGCGLRGMRERLEALGGTLEVRTPVGHGVELTAALPLWGTA